MMLACVVVFPHHSDTATSVAQLSNSAKHVFLSLLSGPTHIVFAVQTTI